MTRNKIFEKNQKISFFAKCTVLCMLCFFIINLSSCKNLFGKKVSDDQIEVTLSGSFITEIERTANPVVPASMFYTVTATQTAPAATPAVIIDGIVTGTDSNATFTIKLLGSSTGITYTLTANAWKTRSGTEGSYAYSDLIFTGTLPDITLTDVSPSRADLDFTMVPVFSEDNGSGTGKGTVKLPLAVETTSTITSAIAKWTVGTGEDAVVKTQELTLSSASNTADFTMLTAEEVASSVTTVDAGVYNVDFYFFRGTDADSSKRLTYACKETINVYSNLETNTWEDSNANGSDYFTTVGSVLKLYVSNTLADSYERNTRFVKSGGNDSGAGSFYEPFATVTKALSVIKAMNDGQSEYSIVLVSDIEDSSTDSYSASDNYAYLNLNASVSTPLNLSLYSYNFDSNPFALNVNCSSTKTGRAIYIGDNVSLSLKDIEITGGCTNENGAGVYLSSGGNLSISGKVIVSENTKTDGSKNNVYLSKNSSDIQQTIGVKNDITGSLIGLQTELKPTESSSVAFTNQYGQKFSSTKDPYFIFKSDLPLYTVLIDSVSQEATLCKIKSGDILIGEFNDIEFRVLSNPTTTDLTITINVFLNEVDITSECTDWKISITSLSGKNRMDSQIKDSNGINTNSATFLPGCLADNYRIYVSATYSGFLYSGTFIVSLD